MLNISRREKGLLIILIVMLALMVWYRIFSNRLLPQYRELKQELTAYPDTLQELPRLREQLVLQTKELKEIQAERDLLAAEFSPASGFLLNRLGTLAEGKVSIESIEPQEVKNEGLYQCYSMAVAAEGNYEQMLEYLRTLENEPGIKIGTVEIRGNEALFGQVTTEFMIHQYVVPKDRPATQSSVNYEPYRLFNPFETVLITESVEEGNQIEPEGAESPADTEFEQLAPYNFPVR